MIGAAYLHLRAQIGTGLFSLQRLASEAGVGEITQTALRSAHDGLRAPLVFIALGAAGSGKSTLLNKLFDREFCGAHEPITAGKRVVYKNAADSWNKPLSPGAVECERTHIFLRDFTVLDAPGFELPPGRLTEDLAPFLPGVDLILFVVAAGAGGAEPWRFLQGLGREILKRLVLVVWQTDRGTADEAALAVKRLRQAMLKHLGQGCPIFAASKQDQAGREKLARWIENEVVFSETRRARFREIGGVAQEAMRQIAGQPRAAAQGRQRESEALERLRAALTEREEQSQRQIAGMLWILVQSFDSLRQRGETLLGRLLTLPDLARGRSEWPESFIREIETQARESLTAQIKGALLAVEADLQHAAEEYARDFVEAFKGATPGEPPQFPRDGLAEVIGQMDVPLELPAPLTAATARAARLLRLPLWATLAALVVTLGAWPVWGLAPGSAALAAGTLAVTLVLALLLRRNVVAEFGRHFTTNRTLLLTAIEGPLRAALEEFYTKFVPPLDARAADLTVRREGQEPLLARLRQVEQTFARLEADLRHPPPPPEVSEELGHA